MIPVSWRATEFVIWNKQDDSAQRVMISSVRIRRNPKHWEITVWNRGGNAGTLTVDAEDGERVVDLLLPPSLQSHDPAPNSPAGYKNEVD